MISLEKILAIKSLAAAACLFALAGARSVDAHHLASERGYYLVYWIGYQPSSQPRVYSEDRLPPQFWKQAFVSIYAQGSGFSGMK